MFFRRLLACFVALTMVFSTAYAQDDQTIHLLLIGVDSSSPDKAGRSDTMMLAQIRPQSHEVKLVSFLRDLYVPIPGYGRARLNAAYFHGGETLLKETLTKNFGITIDRTVTVHFSALADMVDDLGGIEIDITEEERRHLNKLLKDYGGTVPDVETPGLQRLNGLQALTYSRIRKLDSDFQRTSRQHTVIAAMLRQMAQMTKWELFKMAVTNLGRVQTSFSLSDLYRLSPIFGKIADLTIQSAHIPFEGTYTDETISGMMVLKADLEENRNLLEQFLK